MFIKANADGLIETPQISAHHQSYVYTEDFEDMISDAVMLIESLAGAGEIGLPRAWFEIVEPMEFREVTDEPGEKASPVVHHFAYKTLAYRIESPATREDVAAVLKDIQDEIEVLRAGQKGLIAWRLDPKINLSEHHCGRCGGTVAIRTRVAFVPDHIAILRNGVRS
jgi:hypothetical protein